ncbi:Ycf66 family protein [Iningainema tapete]|uniref:Ycf66 family protein n=1 Tax=Iningainema tapete BLCC-T55 TaxID=2748662 RepID=A0A8J6XDP2_9CYAN|nr:Ycf66 family protein [Iningainema tapete]MBD2771608.1 hypothetical protein [Iningainema tapete BLCC-T55]
MLAYVLALAVGFGSIALYGAAFFFPEIHRKNDFIWSGVGFFYALVLWVFARRITGGLLLGHVASVALLGWFGWQTFSLRRQLTPQAQQTPIPDSNTVKTSLQQQVNNLSLPYLLAQAQTALGNVFSGVKDKVQQTVSKKTPQTAKTAVVRAPRVSEVVEQRTPTDKHSAEEAKTPASVSTVEVKTTVPDATTEDVPELVPPNPPPAELVEAALSDVAEEKIRTVAEVIPPDNVSTSPVEAGEQGSS